MPKKRARSRGAAAGQESACNAEAEPRVDPFSALSACASTWQEARSWTQCLDGLGLVEESAARVGQLALYDMCVIMRRRLSELADHCAAPADELLTFINLWPTVVATWLETSQDPRVSDQLMAFLSDSRWLTPLPEGEAETLRRMLYIDEDEPSLSGCDTYDDDDDGVITQDLYVDVSHDLVIGRKRLPSAPRKPTSIPHALGRDSDIDPPAADPMAGGTPPLTASGNEERALEQVEALLEEMAQDSVLGAPSPAEETADLGTATVDDAASVGQGTFPPAPPVMDPAEEPGDGALADNDWPDHPEQAVHENPIDETEPEHAVHEDSIDERESDGLPATDPWADQADDAWHAEAAAEPGLARAPGEHGPGDRDPADLGDPDPEPVTDGLAAERPEPDPGTPPADWAEDAPAYEEIPPQHRDQHLDQTLDQDLDHAQALLAGLDDLDAIAGDGGDFPATGDGDPDSGSVGTEADEEFLEIVGMDSDTLEVGAAAQVTGLDDAPAGAEMKDTDDLDAPGAPAEETDFIGSLETPDPATDPWPARQAYSLDGGFDDELETETLSPTDPFDDDGPTEIRDPGGALADPALEGEDSPFPDDALAVASVDESVGDPPVRIDADAFLAPDDIPESVDGRAPSGRENDDLIGAQTVAADDSDPFDAALDLDDAFDDGMPLSGAASLDLRQAPGEGMELDDADDALFDEPEPSTDEHDGYPPVRETRALADVDPYPADAPESDPFDDVPTADAFAAAQPWDDDDIPAADKGLTEPDEAWSQPAPPDWFPEEDGQAAGAAVAPSPSPSSSPLPSPPPSAGAVGELPAAAREMIALLVLEASQSREVLADALGVAADADAPAADRSQSLAHFAEQIERFTGAVELLGLEGLCECCHRLYENVLALAGRSTAVGEAQVRVLEETCALLQSYLEALPETGCAEPLAAVLAAGAWPAPVDGEQRLALTGRLASPQISVDDDTPPRETTATRADVSLRLPEDVDAEVLDGLLQDLPGQTAEFTAAVGRLIAGGTMQDLEVAQRIAHTVKGAANTVGVAGIANLTHHIEDILLALTKHETFPGRSLAEMLVSAADCLESMGEALLGQGPAPADALSTLQQVLDWANRIDVEGIAAVNADAPPPPRPTPTAESEPDEDAEPAPLADEIEEASESAPQARSQVGTTAMVRVPAPLVDELLRLAGENIILTGQVQERLALTAREAQAMRTQYSLVQQLGQELEELVDLHDLSLPRQRTVNGEDFDPLEFDQYNELHTCSRRLIEAALDTRELGRNVEEHLAALVDMLVDQSRLNRENQEAVLHTRMVAVQTSVPRLQRSVRQASRLAGKAVNLTCVGTDTMMDSDVLSGLLDPLMHLLRNAVDHGIEAEDVRMANGKPGGGQITLEFQREGNHIAIRCQDDGGGLDLGAVRATAEARGLLSAGENVSDEELIQLVLRPNFSTRTQATQLSGRGIGLDAVNSRVISLGGSLRLETEAGKGCLFTLRLPLTLISTHALLVRAASQVVAVSTRGVEQILHPESGEVVHFGDQITFRVVDAVYQCTPLSRLLGFSHDRRGEDRTAHPALLVQTESGLHAVLVDGVVDSRDLVVKGMGRYLPRIRGIAGATILGDGSVTPVLDLPELLREPAQEDVVVSPGEVKDEGIDVSMPFALVVDDSMSARRSLAQFMGDSGFQVRTARDGLEAVKVMQSRIPDILLVDLEMPRMNGLELTNHVRTNAATRDLPIIMITSRSTEKHRSQAEEAGVTRYLTKPFAEGELIEHVYAVCGMR